MRSPRYPYALRLAASLISITLLVVIMYYLKSVIVPLLFSIIFAVMLYPFTMRLEKWRFSKGLAAFFTVFFTSIFLGFLAYLLFSQLTVLSDQFPQLTVKMNKLITDLRDFFSRELGIKKSVMASKIQEQIAKLQDSSPALVAGTLGTLSVLALNLFLVPLYIFFLLYYRHFFIEFFYKVFYNSERDLIDETLAKLNSVIKGYLFGQFLDIIIIGAANAVVLYLLGIGYAIVLGFGVAVLCIIPYLGMIAGSVFVLLISFVTTDTTWQPLTAFTIMWVIHIIDSNVVAPYVIGSRVSINPLVALFILLFFGELWGLVGLFLAFPLAAILKVIFDTVPALKPYGFLLGEPQKYHLKKFSMLYVKRKQEIQEMREQEPLNDVLPGEPGADPLPQANESFE